MEPSPFSNGSGGDLTTTAAANVDFSSPTPTFAEAAAATVSATGQLSMSSATTTTSTSTTAAGAAAAANVVSPLDLTQDMDEDMDRACSLAIDMEGIEDDEISTDNHQQMVHIGTCHLSIVGIRYYSGTAHPGEYVKLVREAHNPYDRNAVRVDNMHGEKVGHVKREQAAVLASHIMDHRTLQNLIVVDGTIPYAGNDYTTPLQVDLYWKTRPGEDLSSSMYSEDMLAVANVVEQLQKHPLFYFQPNPNSGVVRVEGRTRAAAAAAAAVPVAPIVQKKNLDWKTQQQDLDEMFDKQSRDQLASLPDIAMPLQLGGGGTGGGATELFEYQRLGIRWLVHQERKDQVPFFVAQTQRTWFCEITNCAQTHPPRPVRGSILADEMGLGKTLQAIGLILANPPANQKNDAPSALQQEENLPSEATTIAVTQESTNTVEEKKDDQKVVPAMVATTSGGGRIPNKTALRKFKAGLLQKLVAKAGVASTGAKKNDLLEACLKAIQQGKLQGQDFSASALEELEKSHLTATSDTTNTIHASATTAAAVVAPATDSINAVCTLVVCPVSVMSNWVQQIESHVQPDALRVALYHGTERSLLLPRLKNNEIDVLIVSYHTLAADYSNDVGGSSLNLELSQPDEEEEPKAAKKRKTKATSTLFDHSFHRVILDEAHTIRSTKTCFFKAVTSLHAKYKLCLTGTPFVNRPDDIHSLLAFLGVDPLADADIFRRAVTLPINVGDTMGLARLRTAMAHVALRRSKAMTQIQLSEKQVELRAVEFPTGPHKAIHDTLFGTARLIFSSTLQPNAGGGEGCLDNYMGILEMLLRIRQACCSGEMVPPERRQRAEEVWQELQSRGSKPLTAEEGKALLDKLKGTLEANEECAVCLSEIDENAAVILRACGHVFCETCMAKVTEGNQSRCPLCRLTFSPGDMIKRNAAAAAAAAAAEQNDGIQDALTGDGTMGMSPKVAALLQALGEMKPDEKGVIFSQFTKFLDLIEKALMAKGHTFTRMDGSKTAPERIRAMSQFHSDATDSPRLILCSLHAAGTGINLTRGNHIFMMDTWWNLAAENQAMDRVHRIGQKRDVRVIRFIMAGSIEDRMVALQESKATIGKGAMEKLQPDEQRKARITALKELFLIGKKENDDDDDGGGC